MLGYIKNNRTKKYNSFKRKKKHKNSKMCQEGKNISIATVIQYEVSIFNGDIF